jgi:hypothetical protein
MGRRGLHPSAVDDHAHQGIGAAERDPEVPRNAALGHSSSGPDFVENEAGKVVGLGH